MRIPGAVFALVLLLPISSSAGLWRPWWTREKPAITTRDGHRVAVAVGYARLKSEALSRDAAEVRARRELLLVMTGRPDGEIKGARVTRTSSDWRGGIYVELEAPLP